MFKAFTFAASCLLVITFIQSCNSGNKDILSKKTLVLSVNRDGNNLKYSGQHLENRPFYSYKSGTPLFEAELYNHQGEKIQTVLFGKIFFIGKGPGYQLTFPFYKDLDHIIIYRLDPSSGHITNKDKQIALRWTYKPDTSSQK